MKDCTLVFPRKDGRIGLAPKHQIHDEGKVLSGSEDKWNGWGGKREWYDFFLILLTAIREFWQESGAFCLPWNLKLVSRIYFYWPGDKPGAPSMHVYIYFLDSWIGTMREKEKGKMGPPTFFPPDEIPYRDMMPGDKVFLPRLLSGERFVANLYFDRKDEKGRPTLEVIGTPDTRIPWHVTLRLIGLILWKKMFS